ncbi:uncharacterized protein LOC141708947 [Apium graveolens]|uniref:uncharacterized protein LOC141708947 n=1 Tax=Apium graveolens TaxID=4045 RepID=UPI003D7BD4B8
MQQMGLLRNVLKSGHLIRVGHQNPRFTSSPRPFSTAGGSTTQDSPPIVDPSLHDPNSGVYCYGAVGGITSHTTKNDILNLLEGCNLTPEDLKVEYSYDFSWRQMMIQFPSWTSYDMALRVVSRRAREYNIKKLDPGKWARRISYDGKALLLQGIPRNAVPDDIDRILSGFRHDGTFVDISTRYVDGNRMAILRFPSAILARVAFLTTIREFCLNNQLSAQILY